MSKSLWKTTIVIWSKYDPQMVELTDLANDATSGTAHCSKAESVLVDDPKSDDDFGGHAFFFEDETAEGDMP